jgi:hypothetical protein
MAIRNTLDTAVTWRSVARIGLGFAAEYALLALIEDASAVLKVATVVCATGALAVLELEDWLRSRRPGLFIACIASLAIIYVGFIGYAIAHVIERNQTLAGLQKIYVSSSALVNREIAGVTDLSGTTDQEGLTQYKKDFDEWEKTTRDWVRERVGEPAAERFLDRSNTSNFLWGARANGDYSVIRNRLHEERRNLATIMESRLYLE